MAHNLRLLLTAMVKLITHCLPVFLRSLWKEAAEPWVRFGATAGADMSGQVCHVDGRRRWSEVCRRFGASVCAEGRQVLPTLFDLLSGVSVGSAGGPV